MSFLIFFTFNHAIKLLSILLHTSDLHSNIFFLIFVTSFIQNSAGPDWQKGIVDPKDVVFNRNLHDTRIYNRLSHSSLDKLVPKISGLFGIP